MDGPLLVSYLALWAVVILAVIMILGLARELGGIHARFGVPGALVTAEGLGVGEFAPDFRATEVPSGKEVTFSAASGEEALLIFTAASCGPCQDLLPKLEAGWDEWKRRVKVFIVCGGEVDQVREHIERTQTRIPMLADPSTEIRALYEHPPTPYAFLINGEGKIKLKGVINSRDEIDRLLEGQARVVGGRTVLVDPRANDQVASSPPRFQEVGYGQVD